MSFESPGFCATSGDRNNRFLAALGIANLLIKDNSLSQEHSLYLSDLRVLRVQKGVPG